MVRVVDWRIDEAYWWYVAIVERHHSTTLLCCCRQRTCQLSCVCQSVYLREDAALMSVEWLRASSVRASNIERVVSVDSRAKPSAASIDKLTRPCLRFRSVDGASLHAPETSRTQGGQKKYSRPRTYRIIHNIVNRIKTSCKWFLSSNWSDRFFFIDFIIYAYFAHAAASITATDDVIN